MGVPPWGVYGTEYFSCSHLCCLQTSLSSVSGEKHDLGYWGYYMPTRRYEFYLPVFNSISHSFYALTRELSSWTLEDKIHIYACVIFCLLYKHQWKRRDLLCNHNDGDLFTCEDIKFSSKRSLGFHWCLYNKIWCVMINCSLYLYNSFLHN